MVEHESAEEDVIHSMHDAVAAHLEFRCLKLVGVHVVKEELHGRRGDVVHLQNPRIRFLEATGKHFVEHRGPA